MKSFITITLLIALLCLPLTSAGASCEGTDGGYVLSAWYNPKNNSFIIESGHRAQNEKDRNIYRDYIIQEKDKRIQIADIHAINWPIREPDGSVMDKYSGKGDVGLTIGKSSDEIALSPSSLSFQRALIDTKLPKSHILPIRDTLAAFNKTQSTIHQVIETNLGYQKISPLSSCPYTLNDQHALTKTTIDRVFFPLTYVVTLQEKNGHKTDLGLLPDPFPGDDRSKTIINQKGKCWGFSDQKTLLVAFRWDWACQGSGDLTFTVDQFGIKKP